MDGATNMNVSNAPPAITAGEAKKLKKTLAKDAAAAEKHVVQVSKSLKSAEKDESKAEKVSPSESSLRVYDTATAAPTAGDLQRRACTREGRAGGAQDCAGAQRRTAQARPCGSGREQCGERSLGACVVFEPI